MIALAGGIYAFLLFALPPAHRRRFGAEMMAAFADACVAARGRRGTFGVLRATGAAARDLVVQIPREWLAAVGGAGRAPHSDPATSVLAPRGGPHMFDWLGVDLRSALRTLRSSPAYSSIVIATLAVGIGATTAVFSVVRGVLLEPLPYPEAERIVTVAEVAPEIAIPPRWVSIPNYADYRDEVDTIRDLSLFRGGSMSVTEGDAPIYVYGADVSADFFRVFRIEPSIGRTFTPQEVGPEPAPVIVLGHGLWERRFGGDASIIGRTVRIDGTPRTVIGVMPAGFDAPGEWLSPGIHVELWAPYTLTIDESDRINRSSFAVGRLRDGATLAEARAQLEAVNARLQADHPEADRNWQAQLLRWRDLVVGDVRAAMNLLWLAVWLVLVVACVNVANLHLARLLRRRHDLAVRKALGASRLRLIQNAVSESVLLSVLGGALGVALAAAGLAAMLRFEPGDLPLVERIRIDGGVLLMAFATSVGTGVLLGVAPVWLVMRRSFSVVAQAGDGRTVAGGRGKLRAGMVAAQVALAFVVATSAALVGRSFARLSAVPPGVDTDQVMTATVALSWDRVTTPAERSRFIRDVVDRIEQVPGVSAAAEINSLPFSGSNSWNAVWLDGNPAADPTKQPVAAFRNVTSRYLETMGIPLLRGRWFNEAEMQEVTAAVINEAFADGYWGGVDPIGRTIAIERGDVTVQVVGIVADVHHFGLDVDARPEIYLPYTRDWLTSKTFVARGAGDPAALGAAMRAAILAVDPEQPLRDVRGMAEVIGETTAGPRFNTMMMGIAAAIAVGLATLGLFGSVSFMVIERTRELGIRLALGGSRPAVVRRVLRQGTMLAAIGVLAGLPLAIAGGRALRGLLFEVGATDPPTYVLVALLFVAVAAGASYLPARRASRVDPIVVLKQE